MTPTGGLVVVNAGPPEAIDSVECEYPYLPTLSELIEACGDKLGSLERNEKESGGLWAASESDDVVLGKYTFGETPDDAVARFWLALHTDSLTPPHNPKIPLQIH